MSFLSKAFDNESIGFKCLIFLNLFAGGDPTKFSINFRSFKNLYFSCKYIISFLSSSYSLSEITGLSLLK